MFIISSIDTDSTICLWFVQLSLLLSLSTYYTFNEGGGIQITQVYFTQSKNIETQSFSY